MNKLFFLICFFVTQAQAVEPLVTEEEAKIFCEEHWFKALALGNEKIEKKLEQLLPFYTADAKLVDPNNLDLFQKKEISGHEEISKYYRSVLTTYPNWKFTIKAIYPTPKGFVLHYVGKNAPPVDEFEGVDILTLERPTAGTAPKDFKISRLEEFYDRVPFRKKK